MATSRRVRVFLQVSGALLLSYHLVAISIEAFVPPASLLRPLTERVFRPYLNLTGNRTNWAMFGDRPTYRSIEPTLQVLTEQGTHHHYGALLPGLRPYDQKLRSYKFFSSLMNRRYRFLIESYLLSAKKEIERTHGLKVQRIWLHIDGERINDLSTIQRSGTVTHHGTFRRGI